MLDVLVCNCILVTVDEYIYAYRGQRSNDVIFFDLFGLHGFNSAGDQ